MHIYSASLKTAAFLPIVAGAFFFYSENSNAAGTSITVKYEQTFRENKVYKPKFGLAHKFDNDVAVGIEHNRKWTEGDSKSDTPEFDETILGIAWARPLDDRRFIITPKLEQKYNRGTEALRPSLTFYYSPEGLWGMGVRYRYEYQTKNDRSPKKSRVNQIDLYLDYKLTDSIVLGWNPSYAYRLGDGSGNYYTDDPYRIEHEFKVGYRIAPSHAVAATYKRKDKTFSGSQYNAGRHDDALQLAYTYSF
ncbi:oligogalacturonate-specific porin KdgM family protein [Kushneria sp. EE4]